MNYTPKTVLYVRVSTAEQTSAHQLDQARAAGFKIEDANVIVDHNVSGVSTRLAERDQGRRLFDLLQPGDTLLVRWINRLGRDYDDVKSAIETFNRRGVTVKTVINSMVFKSDAELAGDPVARAVQNAILGFMAAHAESEATAQREARRAGIAHAKARADAHTLYRGKKPTFDRETFNRVRDRLSTSAPVASVARETGLSRQAVQRIKSDPEKAEAALARWGL